MYPTGCNVRNNGPTCIITLNDTEHSIDSEPPPDTTRHKHKKHIYAWVTYVDVRPIISGFIYQLSNTEWLLRAKRADLMDVNLVGLVDTWRVVLLGLGGLTFLGGCLTNGN
jgi:hypothetical protein